MPELMEIKTPTKSMRLYTPPSYEEWFDSHAYDWRLRNRTFRDKPNTEMYSLYHKGLTNLLKWQGKLIKTFMRNSDGN